MENFPKPDPEQVPEPRIEAGKIEADKIEADRKTIEQWFDAEQIRLDAIYASEGREKMAAASIESSMERARLYHKLGYVKEAIADLEGTVEAASAKVFAGTGLFEHASKLLEEMKA